MASVGSLQPEQVVGRYRVPPEMRWGITLAALVSAAFVGLRASGAHLLAHYGHDLVAPITFGLVALLAWTIPMTRISPEGIKRWWSPQQSWVPWERVREIEVRPRDRRNKYPVHARLVNDDTVVLIGVPASAADALRELARRHAPASA